jgi:hypothetical protein
MGFKWSDLLKTGATVSKVFLPGKYGSAVEMVVKVIDSDNLENDKDGLKVLAGVIDEMGAYIRKQDGRLESLEKQVAELKKAKGK